ncbi:protein ACCELERATED CELL DEATH 6-like isoform X2 [Fagus crenata]
MASTSSSCPDAMQLRKEESSVPMDDIPIAEMKKLEVPGMFFRMGRCDIKMNQRQQQQQQHSESSIPADFPNDAEMVTKMNPELYKAVKGGKIEYIQESAGDVERSILLETSPKLNTILHVAASSGHDQLLELEDSTVGQLWKQNKEGNTPLHLALINKYRKVALKTKYRYHELASFLVEKDPKVSTYFRINKEGKSPLYLAAEAGDAELVNLMIKKGNSEMEMLPGDGKSIVHAAIYVAFTTMKRDVLDTVLRNLPDLIKAKDDKGMTPLSYAASIGYLDGVQCLLDKSSDCAYKIDNEVFFPIHTASRKGHIQVIEFFLKEYPDLSELLNIGKGQNILHVAAMSGKAKVW